MDFKDLKNGAIDLSDIAEMNDALDVLAENEWRSRQAERKTK